MRIHVLVHQNEDGYWAEARATPYSSCLTQGDTLEEIMELVPGAVELMLEDTSFEGAEFTLSYEMLPFEVFDA